MRIEKVDFFYLSMPTVTLEEDGSQDVLLVRVLAGGYEGWGECEASPLVSIAAYCTPRSHGACRPVSEAVLGADLNSPQDIERVNQKVRQLSLDLLQADHTLSGIDVALWDLLGRKESAPVWSLMGAAKNLPKRPYASVLFGDSPDETAKKAREIRTAGFSAAKFGWNGFGTHELERDEKQLGAARQGLGENADLMVDVGTVWTDDVRMASERASLMPAYRVTWLEEPFLSAAPDAYGELAARVPEVPLAGGEGSHNFGMAKQLIDYGKIAYVQIDAGRVGGLTTARQIARYAKSRGVKYVNHTFTSNLALSASLQAYVDLEESNLAEYPLEPKPLCRDLTKETLTPDADGFLKAPERPGLGMTPRWDTIRKYLKQVQIKVDGQLLYETPETLDG